jgi:hypothetical protein
MSVELERALFGLLFCSDERTRLRQASQNGSGDTFSGHSPALRDLRWPEVEAFASLCRSELLCGTEGNGGLSRAFPRTLELLVRYRVDTMSLMEDFLQSTWFARARTMPFAGRGISVEEAFYRFLVRIELPELCEPPACHILAHEFFSTIMTLLAVNRDPAFEVDCPEVRRRTGGWWTIQLYPVTQCPGIIETSPRVEADDNGSVSYLYAACQNSLLKGYIAPAVARLIELGKSDLAQHNDLRTTALKLRDLGLLT